MYVVVCLEISKEVYNDGGVERNRCTKYSSMHVRINPMVSPHVHCTCGNMLWNIHYWQWWMLHNVRHGTCKVLLTKSAHDM